MGILSAGFQGTFQWILHHGYPLMFVLMFIEGPIITAAAAFAAALHYFNVWVVFLLSVIANILPDGAYYALGYWGRKTVVKRYGHYLGITKEKLELAEKLAEDHSGKSLFLIKMIPFLATPGLIIIGATRMDWKKYAFWCIVIIIPSSLLYLIIGYYFGAAYSSIAHYVDLGTYFIVAAILVVIGITYLQNNYFARLGKKTK